MLPSWSAIFPPVEYDPGSLCCTLHCSLHETPQTQSIVSIRATRYVHERATIVHPKPRIFLDHCNPLQSSALTFFPFPWLCLSWNWATEYYASLPATRGVSEHSFSNLCHISILLISCNQSNLTATWHAKHQVSCVLFACQASSRPSSPASSGRSTPDGGHAHEAPVLKTTSEPPLAGLTSLTSSSPAPSAPPSPNARVTSKKGSEILGDWSRDCLFWRPCVTSEKEKGNGKLKIAFFSNHRHL